MFRARPLPSPLPSPHAPSLLPHPNTQALRAARAEVRAALADAELTLHHLDAPRRVEAAVLAGPEADLPGFLRSLAELGSAVSFLEPRRDDLPAADAAVDSAAGLRRDGLALALRNFVTLLQLHGDRGGGGEGGDADGGDEDKEDGAPPAAARWRPSDEGAAAAVDEDAVALDDDSEGSEAAADASGGGEDGRAPSSSPFLRVADPPPPPPSKAVPTASVSLLPAPVMARLRALAEAMMGAPGQATCVKVRGNDSGVDGEGAGRQQSNPHHPLLSLSLSHTGVL